MLLNNRDRIRFFVIGDWGREGRFGQKDTADCMAEIAGYVRPDFVVSTGDNFYEFGVSSTEDILWELSYETVYHQQSLQIPWYAVLGNHDYVLNPEAQVEYTKKSKRWRMPARFYTQTFRVNAMTEALFVFLDTTPLNEHYYSEESPVKVHDQDPDYQLEWLERVLRESRCRWKIVVGHHTVFSGGFIHGDNPELIEKLQPIFEQYGVQAYLCGHDHDAQHLKPQGVTHYFVSGAGSQMRTVKTLDTTLFATDQNTFLDVVLVEDFMQVRFIRADGLVAYSAHIEPEVVSKPLMFIKKPKKR